jgi:hypothetical protein
MKFSLGLLEINVFNLVKFNFQYTDSSTPLRLDTCTPTVFWHLTGFMGSPLTSDSELMYRGPTLIVTSDLPLWVRKRVWRWCGRWCGTNLCVVSWDIHLYHVCAPSGRTVMSRNFWCTWVRSDSCTSEWPIFGPAVPFQTPVVMTQEGGCVHWLLGRDDHNTDARIYAWSRVVCHLNSELCIPSFWGFDSDLV